MTGENFIKRLMRRLKSVKGPSHMDSQPAQNADELKKLMHMIEHTKDVEISCDEVFALIDQYAEMAARGEDVAHLMPLVKHHLEMCADCSQEYEALMRLLESSEYRGGLN